MRRALIVLAVSIPTGFAVAVGPPGGGGGPPGGGGGGASYSDPPAGGAISVEWFDNSGVGGGGVKKFADVDWSTPEGSGTLESFPYSNGHDPFWAAGPTDEFAIRATGTLTFPEDGTYTLSGYSKDGTRLTIDGVVVLNKDQRGGSTVSENITLNAGDYPFELLFFTHMGAHELDLRWSGPGVTTGTIPATAYAEGGGSGSGGGELTGDTYYVAPGGNDSANGLTPAAAWRTLNHAAQNVGSGDTVYVGAGVYAENVEMDDRGDGSQPIRFIADTTGTQVGGGGVVLIDPGSGVPLTVDSTDGFEFYGFSVDGSDHSDAIVWTDSAAGLISGCQFENAGDDFLELQGSSSELIIEDSVFRTTVDDGLKANAGRLTIRSTVVTDAGDRAVSAVGSGEISLNACVIANSEYGIYLQHGDTDITNTIVHSIGQDGIRLTGSFGSARIWNCTIADIGRDGVLASAGSVDVRNSIFYGLGDDGIDRDSGASCSTSHCLYFDFDGNRSEGFDDGLPWWNADPLFGTGTYEIEAGSPAIDVGSNLSSLFVTDVTGADRPAGLGWDIGAFEFGAGAEVTRPGPGNLSADYFHELGSTISATEIDWTRAPDRSDTADAVTWGYNEDPLYAGGPADNVAVRVRGVLNVPSSGEWGFTLGSEDSVMVLLNGRVLFDGTSAHNWGETSTQIWLPAGEHRIQIYYLERSGDQGLELSWTEPGEFDAEPIPAAQFDPWQNARVSAWGETGYDRTMIARLRAAAVENGLVELGSDAYNAMNTMGDALAVFGATRLEDVAEEIQIADVPDPE